MRVIVFLKYIKYEFEQKPWLNFFLHRVQVSCYRMLYKFEKIKLVQCFNKKNFVITKFTIFAQYKKYVKKIAWSVHFLIFYAIGRHVQPMAAYLILKYIQYHVIYLRDHKQSSKNLVLIQKRASPARICRAQWWARWTDNDDFRRSYRGRWCFFRSGRHRTEQKLFTFFVHFPWYLARIAITIETRITWRWWWDTFRIQSIVVTFIILRSQRASGGLRRE